MAPITQKTIAQEKRERKVALKSVEQAVRRLLLPSLNSMHRRILVSLDNKRILDVGTAVAVAERFNELAVNMRHVERALNDLFISFDS